MFEYDDVIDSYDDEAEDIDSVPVEYGIDFETGQMTGQKVRGSEAVKVWAWVALQTDRNLFFLYTNSYGEDFNQLRGKKSSNDYFYSEAKRMVQECLSVNKYIQGIKGFECTRENGKLTITFIIVTKFGEEQINV